MKRSPAMYILIAAVVFLAACFCSPAFARESRSIAVLGFVNLGNKSDASVNKSITRSLITFLSKINEINITSYEAVEKAALDNKYWESKNFSPDAAVDMGMALAVSEVVSGDYAVDHKKGTVTIDVYVYDTASAAMKLQRQYTGDAGLGLFDTVDKMIRNVSTLITGRTIKMGRLQVEIEGTDSYKLSINGKFMKKISKSDGYSDSEIAEEPLDITLSVPATEEVIFKTNVSIGDGAAVNITYNPNPSASVSGTGENETASKETGGKMKIAVLDFETESGTEKKDLLTLTETLRAELAKTGIFEVISKKQLYKMLNGTKYGTADLASDTDSKARLKLGKLLNAKLAVTGVVNSAFKNISLNIHLLDLETGEILMAEAPSCAEDSVFREVHEISLDIADKSSNVSQADNNKSEKPGAIRIVPNNLVGAGNFPDGSVSASGKPGKWRLFLDNSTKGHVEISSGACKVVIEKPAYIPWYVQLIYGPVGLSSGNSYTLTFDVRSDAPRRFFVIIDKNESGYKVFMERKRFDSTAEWQTITLDFKSAGSDNRAQLEFDCANDKSAIYFRNVSLVESEGEK